MSNKIDTLSAAVAASIFKNDVPTVSSMMYTPAATPEVKENKTEEKPVDVVVKDPTEKVILKPKKTTVDKSVMRIKDVIATNLEKYTDPKSKMHERIQALAKVVDGVSKQPKKDILDSILKFFYQNRDNELLSESQALQGISTLETTLHYKVRIFYSIMMSLANNTANTKNTSIEVIRNLFRSDDFPNWVAIQLAKRSR